MHTLLNQLSRIGFLLFCCLLTNNIYAQRIRSYEIEGSFIATDIDDLGSAHVSAKYGIWFNPYIATTLGARFSYADIDKGLTLNNIMYDIDEKMLSFNTSIGLRLATPTVKRMGMEADFNFLFSPIPFNFASIDKHIYDTDNGTRDKKSNIKTVYTHFNPSYEITASLFYETRSEGQKLRISLGGGITNYNPYNLYYRTKIDGVRLRDYMELRPDDLGVMVFIRLAWFK